MRALAIVAAAVLCACGSGRSSAPVPGGQGSGDPAGGGAGSSDPGTATNPGAGAGAGSSGAAGGGTTAGGPAGSGTAVVTCTPKARPACAVFEVDPHRAIACRAQPVPALAGKPALPTEISAAAACDDREYDSTGTLYSHTTRRFDAAGHPTQVITAATSGTMTSSFQYDGCGHLIASKVKDLDRSEIVAQTSDLYGADGLLRSSVTVSYGQCGRSDFEYTFDDQGRVKSILDASTCIERHRFTYDASGHVSQVDDLFGEFFSPPVTGATSGTSYSYHPNGAVHESKWRAYEYGVFSDSEYDADGYMIGANTNAGTGSTANVDTSIWSYDSSHRILELDQLFTGVGCKDGNRRVVFDYDTSGELLRMTDSRSTMRSPCSAGPDALQTTEYSRPSPGVTVAEHKDDGGNVVLRETTTFDAKGNATSLTRAIAPDFVPVRVFQRDFSCHK